MRSPHPGRAGFTLVELLVAITLLVILFSFGFIVNNRSYGRATVETERDTVVGLLSRARNQAMNNVDQANHGLEIGSSSYVVYEGASYGSRIPALDQSFPKAGGVTATGLSDINFEALDGLVSATGTIGIQSDQRSAVVTVTREGMIDW